MAAKFNYNTDHKRVVLIVDDEEINRELLGLMLQGSYDVIYAENGAEALEIIKENKNLLSLILLDLIMPEMDGFELLGILKAEPELAQIPVVVLTAEDSAEVKSLRMGAADFIKKPYNMPEVILARISRIIELNEGRFIIRSASQDELTGLYTKDFFFEYAQLEERYHTESEHDAVVINVDRFHLVNELYGREFGDNILKAIAHGIESIFTDSTCIACRAEADIYGILPSPR